MGLARGKATLLRVLSVVLLLQIIAIAALPSYVDTQDTQQGIRRVVKIVLATKGVGVGVGRTRSTIYVDFSIGDVMVRVPVDVEGSKACCIYAIAIVGTYDLELGEFIAFGPYTYKGSSGYCEGWLCWRYCSCALLRNESEPHNQFNAFMVDTSTCQSTGYAQVIYRDTMVCKVTYCTWWRLSCRSWTATRDINLSISVPCSAVLYTINT